MYQPLTGLFNFRLKECMKRIIFLFLLLGFSQFTFSQTYADGCYILYNFAYLISDPNYDPYVINSRNACVNGPPIRIYINYGNYQHCVSCSNINCPVGSQFNSETAQCDLVSSSSSAPSCNIGEEVWADYAIEDEMPVCTGGCTGTRSPGACYSGIGCQVKFTITGPCEEETCQGDECNSGGDNSSSSSDSSAPSTSSSAPSTSSSGAGSSAANSSANGGGGDGSGDGSGSGSGSSGGNSGGGGGDDDSGDDDSSGDCDPTAKNYFECSGLVENATSSMADFSGDVSSAVSTVHDQQINDIQQFEGVPFNDKADFFRSKLESYLPSVPTCTPITITNSYFNVSATIPCEKFETIKSILAWLLSFSTVWYIFQLAVKPVDR